MVTFFPNNFCEGNLLQPGASWWRLRRRKKLLVTCLLFWPTWPAFIFGGILCIFCPKHSPPFQLSCRCVPQIEVMTSVIPGTNYNAMFTKPMWWLCLSHLLVFFSSGVVVRAQVCHKYFRKWLLWSSWICHHVFALRICKIRNFCNFECVCAS